MNIAVFCGSSSGVDPIYEQQARALARALVAQGHGLVYGGGRVGLMGVIADAVLEAGGEVIGVIPQALKDREIQHTGITELHVVENMHQRKAMMAELADGFIAMPGGAGTLEEIFEVWTWAQLGYHHKPCGFFNVIGYYDGLIGFLEHMVDQGFMKPAYREMLTVDADPEVLVAAFADYQAPVAKWEKQ
ncbi:hypothetical protein A6D6_02773 [Alcanivorax xiamenensis]|uniref:Cytokinin riboside 5'-monophosphate phosphoribohydrolase n=1 Tax=Alcanivorax xiamenensis TaxID=1177156 RepID=A0ABQ6Y6A3_9GAMM|nr:MULTISPECIES: TIGR00730 family Rossman fold protein [Alcanivorax]KAF0804856.1 hypothetical protein A6D6_02773 [Alcanivorax xiamenensis]